jgi:hypothetical protein
MRAALLAAGLEIVAGSAAELSDFFRESTPEGHGPLAMIMLYDPRRERGDLPILNLEGAPVAIGADPRLVATLTGMVVERVGAPRVLCARSTRVWPRRCDGPRDC